ncbi:MAG: hypothetical protein ISF22_10700 [Methanomassiliicoccus sp.]|nr:hypothetical protein [Methanomassiliicoccus sp.]
MIEFVMSRVWMVIAGVAVMAVIVASFAGLDRNVQREVEMEGAETLAAVMNELAAWEGQGETRVEVDGLLIEREATIMICPGSIWVNGPSSSRAVGCATDLILVDGGRQVDSLELAHGDHVVIRTAGDGIVQLEKVSATARTAETNLSHSSAVLYR